MENSTSCQGRAVAQQTNSQSDQLEPADAITCGRHKHNARRAAASSRRTRRAVNIDTSPDPQYHVCMHRVRLRFTFVRLDRARRPVWRWIALAFRIWATAGGEYIANVQQFSVNAKSRLGWQSSTAYRRLTRLTAYRAISQGPPSWRS
jgi:hypothetical protein